MARWVAIILNIVFIFLEHNVDFGFQFWTPHLVFRSFYILVSAFRVLHVFHQLGTCTSRSVKA